MPHWSSQEWRSGATLTTDCESDAQIGLRSTLLENRTNKEARACATERPLPYHSSDRSRQKLNVRNSVLKSIGYKCSGKFKLAIPTEVHCSINRHIKLGETSSSCIYDESVVFLYIQYLFIPTSSSSAYLYSHRWGITNQDIVRNARYSGIGRMRFSRPSTFFSFVDRQVYLTEKRDKARNHKTHWLLAFRFVFT